MQKTMLTEKLDNILLHRDGATDFTGCLVPPVSEYVLACGEPMNLLSGHLVRWDHG